MHYTKTIQPLMVASTVLLMMSCSSKKENTTEVAEPAISVRVALPKTIHENSMDISGQVVASTSASISTRVMGTISQVSVKVGDFVKKGQLLVSITHDDISSKKGQAEAMIAEAEANYKNAEKDLERFKNLYKLQSATAKELDNVTLQYQSAKARLDAAKQMRNEADANLAYTSLTAPFEGVVTQKFMDAGSIASPGMPILTVEQKGSLEIAANVPEDEIQSVQQKGIATVSVKSLNKTFEGEIKQIAPSSQFTGGQYVVKITIPEKEKTGLYSGMYVNVNIPVKGKIISGNNSSGAILVPASSIVYKDQLTGLYAVSKNHTALLRWVRLGKTTGNETEVLSGIAADELFVVSSDGNLYNGAAITEKK